MDLNNLAVIVLAAGRGTRFGESYTKLLHPIFDKPLIYYPIQNLHTLQVINIFVVISDPKVEDEVKKYLDCSFVYMDKPTGTADAVKIVLPQLPENTRTLLILNGDDATLYSRKTLEDFIKSHDDNNAKISMMTLKTGRQMEVGRIIRDKNKNFSKILEYKEYLKSGVKSNEINCGVYLINSKFAETNLSKIQRSQSGENYLTDLLNIAKENAETINLFVLKNHSEWIGINDKKDLKYAEGIIKKRDLMGIEKRFTKSVHFLGIAGSGTSACAKLAEAAGYKVSGCDKNLSGEFTETLKSIKTFQGHNPNHLEGIDILAVTPAVLSLDPDNPEILEAKRRKIKIMTWQEFMGKYLTKNKFVIAVSGTHGKSTTTAMVGKILEDTGLDPTVLLGATTSFWNTNFRIGKGKYFVIEADEFNDNFMSLNPNMTILNNLEFDHPEYFKDFDSYKTTFQNFLHKTKNLIIANLSDKNVNNALSEKPNAKEKFFPPVIDFSKNLIDFPLKVTGHHNILNASAAFNLALNLEIPPEKIKQSLMNYQGIGRRMELIGQVNSALIFSDFAHHPTAIKVATEQIKKQFPDKRIWLVYQPHMFSRTKALFSEFVEVFKNLKVERVSMLEIYPSREKDTGLIKTQDLIKAIKKPNIQYTKGVKEILAEIKPRLSEKDVLVFMGAGDIDQQARLMIKNFKNKGVLNSEQSRESRFRYKRILILGLGLNEGGVGSARFFAKQDAEVLVTDIKTEEELEPSINQLKEFPKIQYHLGGHSREDIEWADLIIRNQAIKPDNPFLKYAKELGKQVEMDMGIFLEFADPKKIIGVTGTKGKSTTSSMIQDMLISCGRKVLFGGNIGKSVLDLIPYLNKDSLILLELSSFQLEAWDEHILSPHIAIITNIFPDHLNYYESFEHYKNAKKLIGKNQTGKDFLIINKNDPNLSPEFLSGMPGKIIYVSSEDLGENFSPRLIGEHNKQNFAAALKVAEILEIKKQEALKALENFSGVPFRLELIKEWNGIKIYNNTTATGPEPAIESLKALPGCILIAGGMNKGLKYEKFAKAINLYSKSLYLLDGDASTEIDSLLQDMKSSRTTVKSYQDLEELLLDVKAEAKEGDVILFSPGATSFNLFQNEFDRGRKFNEAVDKIFK